ncbi:hypothetical protein [Amycolatopsis sp. NBC_01480]|uniref:hypothetical protein n=1 Tax=Amycolatopsis sp. NBC_01480 TaxID=2903562 RepID=UPI002E2B4726|nr:hypothetical protein [Amycolatopsis sp. NBC_01480]
MLITAIVAAVVVLTPSPEPEAVAYANVSRNYRVCMLSTTTDAVQADRLWPAVQAATTRTPINAERVTAPTGTSDQLTPYLNSLIAQHCRLIVAPGPDLAAPAATAAQAHPDQHFLTSAQPTAANVSTIPARPADLTTAIVTAARTSN